MAAYCRTVRLQAIIEAKLAPFPSSSSKRTSNRICDHKSCGVAINIMTCQIIVYRCLFLPFLCLSLFSVLKAWLKNRALVSFYASLGPHSVQVCWLLPRAGFQWPINANWVNPLPAPFTSFFPSPFHVANHWTWQHLATFFGRFN